MLYCRVAVVLIRATFAAQVDVAAVSSPPFKCGFVFHTWKPSTQREFAHRWRLILAEMKQRNLTSIALNFGNTMERQTVDEFVDVVLTGVYELDMQDISITAVTTTGHSAMQTLPAAAQKWVTNNAAKVAKGVFKTPPMFERLRRKVELLFD